MTPEQQYPSTHDCAKQLNEGDDPVLLCLLNARARVEDRHTRSDYINAQNGAVCAVGAVFAADGLENEDVSGIGVGNELLMALEHQLSREAKEAIDLLNEAALRLHPEAEEAHGWSGALEWVNQEWRPEGVSEEDVSDECDCEKCTSSGFKGAVKAEVLSVYDEAIERRRVAVTA